MNLPVSPSPRLLFSFLTHYEKAERRLAAE
jgi:hypothetical protein